MTSRLNALLLLGALFPLACTGNEEVLPADGPPRAIAPEPGSRADSLAVLRAEILDRVGNAEASSEASCRSLPFGAKPCGGPWSYLVFSTETTDSAALASLVERYNAIQGRLNEEEGRISDCALVMEPRLKLEGGQCVATDVPAG